MYTERKRKALTLQRSCSFQDLSRFLRSDSKIIDAENRLTDSFQLHVNSSTEKSVANKRSKKTSSFFQYFQVVKKDKTPEQKCTEVIAKMLVLKDLIIAGLRENEFVTWLKNGSGKMYYEKINEISARFAKLLADSKLTEAYKDIFYGNKKTLGLIAGEKMLLLSFLDQHPDIVNFLFEHIEGLDEVQQAWRSRTKTVINPLRKGIANQPAC